MARRKRKLEAIEALDRSEMTKPPLLMTNEDLMFWYSKLEAALKNRTAKPQKDPQPDATEQKSEARLEFENMISRIVDRNIYIDVDGEKKNRLTDLPVAPLLLVYNQRFN